MLKLNFFIPIFERGWEKIQIQHLLKLNTQALRELQQRKPNSNTTLVKVKCLSFHTRLYAGWIIQIQHLLKLNQYGKTKNKQKLIYSNTTLVKVKSLRAAYVAAQYPYSNTTLVKVKW